MFTKTNVTTNGVNVGTDAFDTLVNVTVGASAALLAGTPILRDVTQIPGGLFPQDIPPSRAFFNARATDRGVLATTAGAGDVIGVFQGQGNTSGRNYLNPNTVSSLYSAPSRILGMGWVLAGAVAAGTAVTVGSQLIVTSSNVFATVGTPTIGRYIGRVTAYTINTRIPLAVATGSQTVTPLSMAGINVGSSLTIDVSGQQEVVVVTAISATTFTAVFALAHNAGATVQGITSANGASIIPVPGAGTSSALVFADIKACA